MNIYKKISICLLSLFATSTELEATSRNDIYSIVKNNDGTINEKSTERNLIKLQVIFLIEYQRCLQKKYKNHLDVIKKNLFKNTTNKKNSIKKCYPKGAVPYYNNQSNGYPNVNKRRHSYSSRKNKSRWVKRGNMEKDKGAPIYPKTTSFYSCSNCHSCNQCTSSSNFSPSQKKTNSQQQPMTLLATIINPNNIIIIILYGLGYWVIVFRNKKQKKNNLLYLARRL